MLFYHHYILLDVNFVAPRSEEDTQQQQNKSETYKSLLNRFVKITYKIEQNRRDMRQNIMTSMSKIAGRAGSKY